MADSIPFGEWAAKTAKSLDPPKTDFKLYRKSDRKSSAYWRATTDSEYNWAIALNGRI